MPDNKVPIEVKLENHRQHIRSLEHRMDEVEKKADQMLSIQRSIDKLATNIEYMAAEQKKQSERLETLEHVPTEEAQYYKRQIISAMITGTVGVILGAILALIIK